MSKNHRVAVCLWYNNQAEEAAKFYTSLIPNSEVTSVTGMMVTFTLDGVPFQALNGGPAFKHSEAASIAVTTEDQIETDRLWNELVTNGGSESRCGWLKDRFGVSWQIVPTVLAEFLGSEDRDAAQRALDAMLRMTKIEIDLLESAFRHQGKVADGA